MGKGIDGDQESNSEDGVVFVSGSGSDSGANCVDHASPPADLPAAGTVCRSLDKAISEADCGDTIVAISDGFDPVINGVSDKGCTNSTRVSIVAQPSVEFESQIEIDDDQADHLRLAGFQPRACFKVTSTPTTTPDDVEDVLIEDFVGEWETAGSSGDAGCRFFILGPARDVVVRDSSFSHRDDCHADSSANGSQVKAVGSDSSGGETSSVAAAPQFTVDNVTFHDYVVANDDGSKQDLCASAPHKDCLHIFAATNTTVKNSTFTNCHDSHILWNAVNGTEPEGNRITNNWFGPTVLGTNSCCLRGGTATSEVFDGYVISFNSSTGSFLSKTAMTRNNVKFIGNVALSGVSCDPTGGTTGEVWVGNFASSKIGTSCDGGITTGGSNATVLFSRITDPIDLHIGAGSVAESAVPAGTKDGCLTAATDKDGQARGEPCDAGADER